MHKQQAEYKYCSVVSQRFFLLSCFYVKILLMEPDLSAMLKITKWFNIFWHPRIYRHSHLLFSLITSSFSPNLLHTHCVHLKFYWSPYSKANSDNKHLLLKPFGSLAQSNMLTNGVSNAVICCCGRRITILPNWVLNSNSSHFLYSYLLNHKREVERKRIVYFTGIRHQSHEINFRGLLNGCT